MVGMTVRVLRRPSPDALQAVREASERRLNAAELEAWVRAPWAEGELDDALALVAWFSRRYPTAIDRLEAARRAARRARELAPSGSD
jgi:hypothetical protein